MESDLPGLPANAFAKTDATPDRVFYSVPRFVTHIDDHAIAAVTALYREVLPENGVILDLMGSWVAHLPPDRTFRQVIGHGMNEEELKANRRYDRWFVQDLNENPQLPLAAGTIDAVLICVSVQYLQRPVAVFRDIARVVRPGGLVAVTFSNRCFPTKAVAIWQALAPGQHQRLVALYLERAGFSEIETRTLVAPDRGDDPLWSVIGRKRP